MRFNQKMVPMALEYRLLLTYYLFLLTSYRSRLALSSLVASVTGLFTALLVLSNK